jgi:hypothetical protein
MPSLTTLPRDGVGAAGNSSFSEKNPFLQIAWDSTSLGTLMECPAKYMYSIILGKAPASESVHLIFGSHYHKAFEIFHHAVAAGSDYEEAVRASVRYCLEATWDRRLGRPWVSDLPEKNRLTLVRSVVWYLEHFRDDPIKTIILSNGKPAVELSFRTEIGVTPSQETMYLCGHMDRLGLFHDDPWINDYKTTKSQVNADFFTRYDPDNQFSVYTFASDIVYHTPVKGLIVDVAQIGVTFSRFTRGMVHRSKEQHDEWYNDFKWWTGQAYIYAEYQHWPMNTKSCGLYGGCPFRPICGKSPSVREQWLKNAYKDRVWDPLKIRGDI